MHALGEHNSILSSLKPPFLQFSVFNRFARRFRLHEPCYEGFRWVPNEAKHFPTVRHNRRDPRHGIEE